MDRTLGKAIVEPQMAGQQGVCRKQTAHRAPMAVRFPLQPERRQDELLEPGASGKRKQLVQNAGAVTPDSLAHCRRWQTAERKRLSAPSTSNSGEESSA